MLTPAHMQPNTASSVGRESPRQQQPYDPQHSQGGALPHHPSLLQSRTSLSAGLPAALNRRGSHVSVLATCVCVHAFFNLIAPLSHLLRKHPNMNTLAPTLNSHTHTFKHSLPPSPSHPSGRPAPAWQRTLRHPSQPPLHVPL